MMAVFGVVKFKLDILIVNVSVSPNPIMIRRLAMRLYVSTDTPSPPVSTRRSSVSSRPKRLCHSKSAVCHTRLLLLLNIVVLFYFILVLLLLMNIVFQ